MTPRLGTDGNRIVYPVRGIVQGAREMGRHPQRRTLVYVTALIVAAVLTAAALLVAGYDLESPGTVLALALAAAIAERISVRFAVARRGLTSTEEQSLHLLPTLFAAVLFGPLAAAVVGAASMLGDPELVARRDRDRAPRLKWATYTSTRFIGGAAMGLAAQATLAAVPSEFGGLVAASLVGAVVGEVLDVLFAALTATRTRTTDWRCRSERSCQSCSRPPRSTRRSSPCWRSCTSGSRRGHWHSSSSRRWPRSASTACTRSSGNSPSTSRRSNETLERANLQFAAALIATLDARDRYTAGHSAAVAIYSRDIAERMGLPAEIRDQAYLCGLVHDIGKIGLPPGLLEKPGALTLDERRQMQEHSAIGERILAHVDEYSEIATIVRHHHERIDGQGYPDGLADEDIPLVSRIIAVADAYNAMTSDRPYRDAMPSRVARLQARTGRREPVRHERRRRIRSDPGERGRGLPTRASVTTSESLRRAPTKSRLRAEVDSVADVA